MSVTELDEVEALLEKVLPDPTGFGRRLLLQAMARLGQLAEPDGGASFAGAKAFYTTAAAEDVTVSETVTASDQPAGDTALTDINLLLAAALGACDCWGLRADCVQCQGHGSAGWTEPDPDLFEEFVQPAVAKLSRISADGHRQHRSADDDEDSRNHQTVEGENA
jgi:hypothetical protein